MHEHDIMAVHLGRRLVLLKSGDTVPITELFDSDGEECEAKDAVAAVAGPGPAGGWSVVDLRQYTVRMAEH